MRLRKRKRKSAENLKKTRKMVTNHDVEKAVEKAFEKVQKMGAWVLSGEVKGRGPFNKSYDNYKLIKLVIKD